MADVTIIIENTDNKLPQTEWAKFIAHMTRRIEKFAYRMEFTGFSAPDAAWQNACWVAGILDIDTPAFKQMLAEASLLYKQDSIAFIQGSVEFIKW